MEFHEILFLLQLLVVLVIFVAKLYNVMQVAKWMDKRVAFISWIIGVFAWIFGMVTLMIYPTTKLFIVLMYFEHGLFALNTLFLMVELLLLFSLLPQAGPRAYMSRTSK